MSRNPIAAYTHRNGFAMGQVEFKDFLWEALYDPAGCVNMGDTAENLARQYGITRERVDRFAERSFDRAIAARDAGLLAEEIAPVVSESFEIEGLASARHQAAARASTASLPTATSGRRPTRCWPSSSRPSAACRPAAIRRPSSTAPGRCWSALSAMPGAHGLKPMARIIASAAVGVPPEIMGIGPAPAIRAVLEATGLTLAEIDRIEINEAFGAQILACVDELGLDENKLNVNGGAIAIGHPLGATGVRLALTLAHELRRSGTRYGIASACIGGGQGIAMLIENPEACDGDLRKDGVRHRRRLGPWGGDRPRPGQCRARASPFLTSTRTRDELVAGRNRRCLLCLRCRRRACS